MIVCYEIQMFMAIALMSETVPDSSVVNYALIGGLVGALGYFGKSLGQKVSLNNNRLKISSSGTVVDIDAKDSDEKPVHSPAEGE